MNRTRLLLLAAALATGSLTGCESFKKKWLEHDTQAKGTEPLKPAKAEQFVEYVNVRAGRLQSIDYNQAKLLASGPGIPFSVPLRGGLVASQPHNFSLSATGGLAAAKVNLGSNDQQFWVYLDVPTQQPLYVFASHSDFAAGNAKLPGIPFEPDWVIRALGMVTLPAGTQYQVAVDQKARTYTLSWPATLPNGTSVVKEIVFDGDAASDTKPQVKKHVVRDTKGKVICFAEIREAKTITIGQPDQPHAVQYPTRVVLKWEEQKFELDLRLGEAQVNKQFTEAELRQTFTRPNVPNARPIDLAQYNEPVK